MTPEQVTELRYDFVPLQTFMARYNIQLSDDTIIYHMRRGKIDYMKPSRDTFIVMSPKTVAYFKLNLK